MKDEKKFVIDTLKGVYGVTNIADTEYLSDEDPEQVDDDKLRALFVRLDKDKLSTVKTKSFDDGAKAREKKVKSEIETAIKNKFGIAEFDADDLEQLIDHAVSLKPVTKIADLTEAQIEALPYVVGLKNKYSKQLTEKETEFNTKLTAKEKEQEAAKLFGKVSDYAVKKLIDKNPLLPEDKKKADRRIKVDLLDELSPYGWLEQDEEIIPLGKDGAQLTTGNGVLVSLDDLLDEKFENFEFDETPATPARSSAKNGKIDPKTKQQQAPEKPAYTGKIPDNEKEYLALINDRSLSVEQRKSIRDQYRKKKGLI